MTSIVSVFQDWVFTTTMQQQSVLVLALRGPDGLAKEHTTKHIVRRYRASILKAAYLGRPMRVDEFDTTTFMTLAHFSNQNYWEDLVVHFFKGADDLPHHYYMHLIHGAEIIGYKHPEEVFRTRWMYFYMKCCENLHLNPESEVQLDKRLGDWNHKYWDQPTPYIAPLNKLVPDR